MILLATHKQWYTWCLNRIKHWFDVYYKHTVKLKRNVLTCASEDKKLGIAVSSNKKKRKWEHVEKSVVKCAEQTKTLSFSHLSFSHAFVMLRSLGMLCKIFWRCSFFTSTDRTKSEFDGLTRHLYPTALSLLWL